jgi:hypothetical protein
VSAHWCNVSRQYRYPDPEVERKLIECMALPRHVVDVPAQVARPFLLR